MIESIIEELIGLVVEGMVEGSKSNRVPKPLRLVLGIILLLMYAALIGICLIAAITAFRDGSVGFGIFMAALILFFIAAAVIKVNKVRRGK